MRQSFGARRTRTASALETHPHAQVLKIFGTALHSTNPFWPRRSLLQGFRRAWGAPIGTVGSQRIEDVDQMHDGSQQRNIRAGEPLTVPAPVLFLMVMTDDRKNELYRA